MQFETIIKWIIAVVVLMVIAGFLLGMMGIFSAGGNIIPWTVFR